MSGSEVLAAAKTPVDFEGDGVSGFGEAHIGLFRKGDRLLWTVGFFQTGATEVIPGF